MRLFSFSLRLRAPERGQRFLQLGMRHAALDSILCRDMLLKAEQTEFLYLIREHMKTDLDLDAVRELEWYKELFERL